MNKPDQREVTRRNEDYVTNKVLALFAVAAVYLFGFTSLINKLKSSDADVFVLINKVLICICAVATAFCFIMHVRKIKAEGYKPYSVLTWSYGGWVSLVATLCLIFIGYNYDMASKVLYVFIPVGAVLYLIRQSYQAEFYIVCSTHALVAVGLWYMYKFPGEYRYSGIGTAFFWIVCIMCVAAVVVSFITLKTGGKLVISGKEAAPFGNLNTGYTAALYSVTLAFTVACRLIGPVFCYYGMFIVCGFILCSAIYYTAKLI